MAFTKLFYHLIWSTKFRQPTILPEIEEDLQGYIRLKAIQLEGIVYCVGGIEDHIHMAVSIPPTIAISKFVGQIKAISAYRINRSGKIQTPFQWQSGYAIFTFRESGLPTIVRYIQNQKQHHANGTINAALEKMNVDKYKPALAGDI